MGQSGSKTAEQGNAVTGRAVGITGGGALKRLAAPKLPQGAVKANAEEFEFIEVGQLCMFCASQHSSAARLVYARVQWVNSVSTWLC
jgi:hypothetical protein